MADARAVAALALVAVAGVSGCGTQDVSRARVEAAVGATFGNLYARQAHLAASRAGASANCDRGGAAVADAGAGDDWGCLLSWVDSTGAVQQARYALQVRPDGCYKADAESAALSGSLHEFDGCTGAG